ncbi:CoA ester lyase [Aquamicrobium sp. LC103]|uniref:HpcH/HpaI aldolase/citrate lyase family protein n=1 Tax=Aquamicrobium sp. LC103 TaxID=1120658 RepID=UPI000B100470|nr:CoA ester lyase [Aquamicrobium sp. LC103]
MKPIRSLMFVPGHKASWIAKIPTFGADAIVLDLEDSVPHALKEKARSTVAAAIPDLAGGKSKLFVRTNRGHHSYDVDDLRAVVQPGLNGIFVSKAEDPTDIELLHRLISEIEQKKGMAIGSTRLVVPIETAGASQFAFEIASHPRLDHLIAVSARGADLERNLGFTWTAEGTETLYHRSRAVIASRAAKKPFPIGGMWQDVHDAEGLRRQAKFNKQLGFTGEIVLHPAQVVVVNEIYSPSAEEIDHYRGLIAAFAEAEKKGDGAVMYRGEHIDIAHAVTAREFLELWDLA